MEGYQLTSDHDETNEKINYAPIQIEQNQIIYNLNIESKGNKITFSINDKNQIPSVYYVRTLTLEEIKNLNQVFYILNSIKDFSDYLKKLSENKKLNIRKNNDKISLILNVEVLFKQKIIEIDLFLKKKDLDLSLKEIFDELLSIKDKIKEIDILKSENQELKKENKDLKIDVEKLKNENKEIKSIIEKQNKEIGILKGQLKEEIQPLKENLVFDKSVIMRDDERIMIILGIENKMNKIIKKIISSNN